MDEETKQLIHAIARDVGTLNAKTDAMSFQIDSLQFDMDAGFATVNEQFEKIDKRLENVDDRFSEVFDHLDGLTRSYSKFDAEDAAMRFRQDRLEARVETLERKIR